MTQVGGGKFAGWLSLTVHEPVLWAGIRLPSTGLVGHVLTLGTS